MVLVIREQTVSAVYTIMYCFTEGQGFQINFVCLQAAQILIKEMQILQGTAFF